MILTDVFAVSTKETPCQIANGDLDMIAPIRKSSNGSWIDLSTSEEINMNGMWQPGQPNGGSIQECTSYGSDDGNFFDVSCSYKSCFVCAWKKEPVFKLRGLCDKTNIEQFYVLLPQYAYGNGNIVLQGFGKNSILFDSKTKSWLITEGNDHIENLLKGNFTNFKKIVGILELGEFNYYLPIGKHFWNITDRCNALMPLKLTSVRLKEYILCKNTNRILVSV